MYGGTAVAPRVGARIEIFGAETGECVVRVAPRVGARIEIQELRQTS